MKKDYSDKNIVSRQSISTEELHQKKRKRVIKHVIITACVLVFFGINYVFWLTPMFKIKNVQIDGEFEPQYKESLQPILDKLFINKHLLFATTGRCKQDIETLVPHLINVSSTRRFPSTITIRIEQRMPVFRIVQPDGSIFIADSDAFVYTSDQTSVNTPISIEIPTSTSIRLNAQLFDQKLIDNISANISQLDNKLGIKVSKISQISNLPSQFRFHSQKRWYLMTDLNNDATNTVQTLKTFLSEKYNLEPSLTYIDLRVPHSVFYQ